MVCDFARGRAKAVSRSSKLREVGNAAGAMITADAPRILALIIPDCVDVTPLCPLNQPLHASGVHHIRVACETLVGPKSNFAGYGVPSFNPLEAW